MVAAQRGQAASDVEHLREDARRWMRRADRLIAAFGDREDPPPVTAQGHLEALRHRRETLATKLAAFDYHRRRGRLRAGELVDARRALCDAWRTAVRSLGRSTPA